MLANMVNVTLFSSSFLVTVVVCGVGAYLSITKVETLGTVVAFVQLLDYVVQPLQELGMLISNFKASSKLVENHQKMADSKEDIWKGQIKKKELNHSIKFANVSFGYGNEAVLKDITVEFKKGCSYAVVGNSGSGKSTLLSMLQGCHDNYNGTIHIDDVELREIQVESFYDLVTIVQQNVFLFDDTIYKNITMYKEFPDQKVDKSINKAGLNELIENRGKLYPCGENGRKLSGGEKQKVSIARALLSEAPIMLMDEVTSALDSISEKAIMNTICELQGLTRIIVTHSMKENHLKNFDNIIVMRDGKIEDIGKYDALYDRKGYFYSLVNLSGNNLTGG